jgi:hypothetical protein
VLLLLARSEGIHVYGLGRGKPQLNSDIEAPSAEEQHVTSFDVICQVHFWLLPTLLRCRLPLNGTA